MKTIGQVLDELITESVGIKHKMHDTRLAEKDKQDDTTVNLFGGDEDNDSGDEEEKKQDSMTFKDDSGDDSDGLPTPEDIEDRLNIVRSGRSLRDDEVQKRFVEYYESLNDNEKKALYIYLKGLGQVLAGDISGDVAVDPTPETEPNQEPQKKSLKPNVIKKPDVPDEGRDKDREIEDDTPPTPVKPVKRSQ